MKIRYWYLMLLLPFLITISCKKSKDGGGSKTELLSKSSWKFDRAGIDADGNGTIDSPLPSGTLLSCDTDNIITFKSDGSGTVDEGPSKCNSTNPQTVPFTWSLKNNETIINFSNQVVGGLGGDVKLISVTDTQLILEKNVNVGLLSVDAVVILKH